jgi:Putative transmembrane protein (PGPGW)
MGSAIKEILSLFKRLGWWGALGVSLALALVSIALAALIVVRWPVNQFKGEAAPPFLERRHPLVRGLGLIAKNVAGYLIVLLGIIMALPGVPGQGFLLILIGMTLLNFPGKRRLERRLIRREAILRMVNRLRSWFGHPNLEVD